MAILKVIHGYLWLFMVIQGYSCHGPWAWHGLTLSLSVVIQSLHYGDFASVVTCGDVATTCPSLNRLVY